MQLLERSGASGITGLFLLSDLCRPALSFFLVVHFRKRGTRTRDPADWSGVEKIIAAVNIPVYANGDFYEPADICRIINMGCSGVLLARPLLMNPSLLRFRDVHDVVGDYYSCRLDRFLSLRDTIRDYVKLCAKYELPYQVNM